MKGLFFASIQRKLSLLGKAPICNERPERGLRLFKVYCPLCIRCVGLCVGTAIGSMLAHHHGCFFTNYVNATLFLLPMAIDIAALNLLRWSGRYSLRAITGVLFGIGLFFFH